MKEGLQQAVRFVAIVVGLTAFAAMPIAAVAGDGPYLVVRLLPVIIGLGAQGMQLTIANDGPRGFGFAAMADSEEPLSCGSIMVTLERFDYNTPPNMAHPVEVVPIGDPTGPVIPFANRRYLYFAKVADVES